MAEELKVLDSAGPTDRVLKDKNGKLRSFPEIMYQFYPSDARMLLAGCLKQMLSRPPQFVRESPPSLQKKSMQLLILEIAVKFCESAEDLAAFAVAFAGELYMDTLPPEEVWNNLAKYEPGDVCNFYREIGKRKPEYFANIHGFPPLHLQKVQDQAILLRSCRQLAAYLGKISSRYMALRELHNSYKHGMRVFPGTLRDNRSGKEVPALSYVDRNANVKAIAFPPDVVEDIYGLCIGIGETMNTILRWHRFRLEISGMREHSVALPFFGESRDPSLHLQSLMFPGLFAIRESLVAKAEDVVRQKSQELSKFPRGHVIAIDIDSEEILDFHGPELRDVLWRALESRPGARLVFRRVTSDGKVGPY
jgi:hypothetical protein